MPTPGISSPLWMSLPLPKGAMPGCSFSGVVLVCLVAGLIAGASATAQECLPAPRQTAPFIKAAVEAKLGALGQSGDGFSAAMQAGLRDIYSELPHADKLVVMHALLAQSCEFLKSLSLPSAQKIAKYKETQERVLQLFQVSDDSLKPGNLKFAVSDGCYAAGLRSTWLSRKDLTERSHILPPAGSPEAAAGLEVAVKPYTPLKSHISVLLREPLAGPPGLPSSEQLTRLLKGDFETWGTENCCAQSAWVRARTTTVVTTDDLAAAAPAWDPGQGLMMTYRRDSKTIVAVAHIAPQGAAATERLGGVCAECRVDTVAFPAYEPYCHAILGQFRFTRSQPNCNSTFRRMRDSGQFLDRIAPLPSSRQ